MIEHLLKNRLPRLFHVLKNWKLVQFLLTTRWIRIFYTSHSYRAIQALVASYGRKVMGGPFQGMVYSDKANCSAYAPKLIGSYEEELHPAIAAIVASNPAKVIDVGCAEGYYAVGLARLLPNAQVYAYDIDEEARRNCAELAALNSVESQVHIRGAFDEKTLEEMTATPAFFLCDCEGYEADLFNPASVGLLKHSDFLIEFHDVLVPNISQILVERFAATHKIEVIGTRPRDPAQYPLLSVVAVADRDGALAENRPGPMQWGYFQALER